MVDASQADQILFDVVFVPALSQAFIYEQFGGTMEVELRVDRYEAWADNEDKEGNLHEDKTDTVSLGGQDGRQLRVYCLYLEEHPDVTLFYNFFASPSRDKFGPGWPFAEALAQAALDHSIEARVYPEGWWNSLQQPIDDENAMKEPGEDKYQVYWVYRSNGGAETAEDGQSLRGDPQSVEATCEV